MSRRLARIGCAAVAGGAFSGPPAVAAEVCTAWAEPEVLAECPATELNESSGLAASVRQPGEWFTHNDAGGSAELYRFNEAGEHLETHEVVGAPFRDWETLDAGPCPAGVEAERCLFIGDVGDNGRSRADVFVYVVAEPASGEPAEVLATWRLGWPDGAEDSEAMVVHPCTGRVYLFTKHNGERDPSVWRLPAEPVVGVDPAPVEYVATLPRAWFGDSGRLTGADWSEGGNQLVVRTYEGAWIWDTEGGAPDAHWATAPTSIPFDPGVQGESVAFAPEGGVLSTSERVPMRISATRCATSVPAPACPPDEPDTGSPSGPDTAAPPDTATPSDPGDGTETGAPARDVPSGGGPPGPEDEGCDCSRPAGVLWVPLLGFAAARRRRKATPPPRDA